MDFQALASGPSRVLLLYVLNHGWEDVMMWDLREIFPKSRDDFGFKGELPEKKYINTLDKDEIFTASYEIKIY